MASLIPCPSCGRHVRIRDAACPFCAAVQPEGRAAPSALRPRAKRAVTFVAASIAVAACGSTTTPETTPDATATADATSAPTTAPTTAETADPVPTAEPTTEPTAIPAPQVRYGLPPYLAADEIV